MFTLQVVEVDGSCVSEFMSFRLGTAWVDFLTEC